MYQLFTPAAPLRRCIEAYWTLRFHAPDLTPLRENVFVDAKADLIFNFGSAYQRHHHDPAAANTDIAFTNLDGQRDTPITIAQQGDIHLVGVRFRPGGLAAFIPIPMHQLSNAVIDAQDTFDRTLRTLEGQLYDAAHDPAQQIAHLDAFFLKRLCLHPTHADTLFIAEQLHNAGGDVRLIGFSNDLGYSVRTVDRHFRQYFGVTPKFYARVLRFNRALSLMMTEPRTPLAEVALRCGYYDQAHFTREFQKLAGSSPSQHRAHLLQRLPARTPNLVQYLQDRDV